MQLSNTAGGIPPEVTVEVKGISITCIPKQRERKRKYMLKILEDNNVLLNRQLNYDSYTFEGIPKKTYEIFVEIADEDNTLTKIQTIHSNYFELKPKAKIFDDKIKYTWNDLEKKEFDIKIWENEELTKSVRTRNNTYELKWKPGIKHDFDVRLVSDGYGDDAWESCETINQDDAGLKPKVFMKDRKINCTWTCPVGVSIQMQINKDGKPFKDFKCSGNKYSFHWIASTKYDVKVRLASHHGNEKHWESAATVFTPPPDIEGVKVKEFNGLFISWSNQNPNVEFEVNLLRKKKLLAGKDGITDAEFVCGPEELQPGTHEYEIRGNFEGLRGNKIRGSARYRGDLHVRYFFFVNGKKIKVLHHVDLVQPKLLEDRKLELEEQEFEIVDPNKTVVLKKGQTYITAFQWIGGPSKLNAFPKSRQLEHEELRAQTLVEKEFAMEGFSKEEVYSLMHIIESTKRGASMKEETILDLDYKKKDSRTIKVKIMLFEKDGSVVALLGNNSWEVDQSREKYDKEGYKVLTLHPLISNLYVSRECVIQLKNRKVQVQPPAGHTFLSNFLLDNDPISRTFTCTINDPLALPTFNMTFIVRQRKKEICVHPFKLKIKGDLGIVPSDLCVASTSSAPMISEED
ncbi:uncharacterized protein LOC144431355 [Styela clava]